MALASDFDCEALGFDREALDITNQSAVQEVINKHKPDAVINAAAYTAVDQAESEPTLAFKVNRDGPAYLASACAECRVPLIHISTDYVFDGTKKGPYVEADPISPLGIYGQSKAAGEDEIRKILPHHIILRTAWLYGTHGKNFVKTMLRLGHEQEIIRVVSDQFGCPTYAADLADAIFSVISQLKGGNDLQWGTYHYCGGGATTWHGFAEAIFSQAKKYCSLLVKRVVPITSSEFPTPIQRPANSVLDCALIKKYFGIRIRPWEESLAAMIDQLYSK
jgi:dTDP-4-dehydrorhamnose reductase